MNRQTRPWSPACAGTSGVRDDARETRSRLDERASAPQAGIVLLDIVVAMAIAALLVLIALPMLPRETTAWRLHGYATEVGAMLKTDRNAAAKSGRTMATRIDINRRRLTSGSAGAVIAIPDDVALDVIASDTCSSDGGQFAISFAADGRSCGAVISLAKGGRDWRIRVNWLTGLIDVVAPGQN
jgi:general secretion pathway protein H